MTTKKFTVTFTSDESTRWLQDDEFIAMKIQFIARNLAVYNTTGSEPDVQAEMLKTEMLKCCKCHC